MIWSIATVLTACTNDGTTSGDGELAFSVAPTVTEGNTLFPLSRAVTATTSVPALLRVSATDGLGETLSWLSPVEATVHELPLVGLHADGDWDVTVQAVDGDGGTIDGPALSTTTGPLPLPMPTIDVLTSVPASMQPGLTIVPIYANDQASYIALVDAAGRVVWLFGDGLYNDKFTEIRPMPNGHLLALNDTDITEIDWMRIVKRWKATDSLQDQGVVTTLPDFHHDVLWSSRDTIVVLSKTEFAVDDFPRDEQDPDVTGPASLANDLIVELSPEDGSILEQWEVTSMLDLHRIGYESTHRDNGMYEWAHVNAVDEDVQNGRWVVSARNQDAVFAVDQASGEVDWILANHDNWHAPYTDLLLDPVGEPFLWPYHQHAVKFDAATGRVMVFDNGNYRATPFTDQVPLPDNQAFSRLVEYTVDEVGRTVTQNWEFRLDPSVFSIAMGDADWLPNGNVLGDFAYIQWQGGVVQKDLGRGSNEFRLVELDPATGTVVWDVDFWAAADAPAAAWQAYRVQRIPRPFAAEE